MSHWLPPLMKKDKIKHMNLEFCVLVTSDRVGNVRAGSGLFLPRASFPFCGAIIFLGFYVAWALGPVQGATFSP